MLSPAMLQAYRVSDVTRYLKESLETDDTLQAIWIRGEISNLTRAASGHIYFSLKDEGATLRCAMFRGNATNAPRLREGMQVIANGRITIYEQRGDLQYIVEQVEDAGIGILYQRFLALKETLDAEGYFALERKRPIPAAPRTIGIVTSLGAAALRDIIRTLKLRWPLASVILAPSLVQGEQAGEQIAAAIQLLNDYQHIDVIVLARGGGSIEDLWSFNERIVADAMVRSRIPIVTGVGHETDFTIADFVADYRAATPTAAAAAVTPDGTLFAGAIYEMRERIVSQVYEQLDAKQDEIAVLTHRLEREHPSATLDSQQEMVERLMARMHEQMRHCIDIAQERLSGSALRLQSLSPLLTIARGYATVTRERDGVAVRAIADAPPAETITIRVSDGILKATVTDSQ